MDVLLRGQRADCFGTDLTYFESRSLPCAMESSQPPEPSKRENSTQRCELRQDLVSDDLHRQPTMFRTGYPKRQTVATPQWFLQISLADPCRLQLSMLHYRRSHVSKLLASPLPGN